ncbi:unnamed protein product [Lepeophtheirus salmonis]|uniref:(salmon louse) hypothetical protein n=2 Tax=Lepeophtheirus salmonis TaxID=72036 RepID=A0A7R8DC25_LEPSM|nr:unnamed protein product [Lepeophtheirus salmonis]CAF3039346.1 unnamed protein product [Lepeophtheirus salmonis]
MMEVEENVIVLKETTQKGQSISRSGTSEENNDQLDSHEKDLIERAKALVSGPKTSEVIDIDDWGLLEMILTLDKGWVMMGEAQAKRSISRNKSRSSKKCPKGKDKETPSTQKPPSGNVVKEEERKCNVCFENCKNYKSYLLHLQDAHNQFKCPYCPKFITQRSHLYRHIRCVHRDAKNFSYSFRGPMCQICFKKFSNRDKLEEHLKGLHDDLDNFKESKEEQEEEGEEEAEEKEEEILSVSESGESESEESEDEEDEEDEYRCQICYKVFQSTSHLRRHKTSVHAQVSERVECIYCKKFYSSPELLKTHYERFHKVKSPSTLNKSRSEDESEEDEGEDEEMSEDEEESGDYSFPCPQCSSQCKSPDELRDHLSSRHGFSNESEEGIEDNNNSSTRVYSSSSSRRQTMKKSIPTRNVSIKKVVHHSGSTKRKAACFICDLVVANKSNLKRHLIRIHGFESFHTIDDALAIHNESKRQEETPEDDSLDISKDDSLDIIKDDSPETLKDDSPQTLKDDSPKTLKDDSLVTLKNDSLDTLKDDSPETLKDDSPETLKDDSLVTLKDDSFKSLKDDSLGTLKDDSLKSLKDDSLKSLKDDSLKSLKDDSLKSLKDDSLKSLKDDSLKSLKDDSLVNLKDDSPLVTLKDDYLKTIKDDSLTNIKNDSPGKKDDQITEESHSVPAPTSSTSKIIEKSSTLEDKNSSEALYQDLNLESNKVLKAFVLTPPKTFNNFKCRICGIKFNKNYIFKETRRERTCGR